MMSFNKEIKLGAYSIVFNRIRNVYVFKKYESVQFKSKGKERVLKMLELLHDAATIDIMELHLFMGFVDDVELERNKPLIGRHSNHINY